MVISHILIINIFFHRIHKLIIKSKLMERDEEIYKCFDSFFSQTTSHSVEPPKISKLGNSKIKNGVKANLRINKNPF